MPDGDFAVGAANEIALRLLSLTARRQEVWVALAGGSTPKPVYEHLAADARLTEEMWGRVHFFWSDERAVSVNDRESNVQMAREALLGPCAIPEEHVHAPGFSEHLSSADAASAAADEYEHQIRRLVPLSEDGSGTPRFDLILLGLGSDGHTASLFPGVPCESDRLVVAARSPIPPVERLSFSYTLLNAAETVLFLVADGGKAETLRRVLEMQDPALPATSVQPTSGSVLWLLDRSSASHLTD